jgi:predicted metal-dependent hydrolase
MRSKIKYAKLIIDDAELTYQIRFSKKAKYLQLRITSLNQLELIIPVRYSIKDGERFINDKIEWVKKYQKKLINQANKNEFYLFGEIIKIEQSFNFFLKKHKLKFRKNVLLIESPCASKITIDELYRFYLRIKAKEYFQERAKYLSKKLGFKFSGINIRGQKTRWGSCSSKGNLSFNYKLLQFSKEVVDYVIIHELCHIKELNHSPKFWKLIAKYCPDYKGLKKELRNEPSKLEYS